MRQTWINEWASEVGAVFAFTSETTWRKNEQQTCKKVISVTKQKVLPTGDCDWSLPSANTHIVSQWGQWISILSRSVQSSTSRLTLMLQPLLLQHPHTLEHNTNESGHQKMIKYFKEKGKTKQKRKMIGKEQLKREKSCLRRRRRRSTAVKNLKSRIFFPYFFGVQMPKTSSSKKMRKTKTSQSKAWRAASRAMVLFSALEVQLKSAFNFNQFFILPLSLHNCIDTRARLSISLFVVFPSISWHPGNSIKCDLCVQCRLILSI